MERWLPLPRRTTCHTSIHAARGRITDTKLLDQCVPSMSHQGQMHATRIAETPFIGQIFVKGSLTDANDAAIAKMVIALAGSLGLAVVAEGVETAPQRHFLALQGCQKYQGYLFSKAIPVKEFEEFATRI